MVPPRRVVASNYQEWGDGTTDPGDPVSFPIPFDAEELVLSVPYQAEVLKTVTVERGGEPLIRLGGALVETVQGEFVLKVAQPRDGDPSQADVVVTADGELGVLLTWRG